MKEMLPKGGSGARMPEVRPPKDDIREIMNELAGLHMQREYLNSRSECLLCKLRGMLNVKECDGDQKSIWDHFSSTFLKQD